MSQNIPLFSVAEFSKAMKLTVENAFGYVKISGEITGLKKATSGHLYFNLKEQNCLLNAVCFSGKAKNIIKNIGTELGDGLQIIAHGQITIYEGRSNYQMIVENIEIAGIGAILEMIEKRKQKLASEGLFDQNFKKPIPYFPKIIGVITSETGAVIEDIKHRILDRCPLHLLLYPSAVQGDKAPSEIIAGIKYFNNLKINRPEVIIIARGGGSFEDLLAFNDENLVREVFKSEIPIISAVGHETDFTLIDLVADMRAPTPTASAEFITPVLSELKQNLNNLSKNIQNYQEVYFKNKLYELTNVFKNIIKPEKYLENNKNNILNIFDKINYFTKQNLTNTEIKLQNLANNIISPQKYLQENHQKFLTYYDKIDYLTKQNLENFANKINKILLDKNYLVEKIANFSQKIEHNFQNISKNIEYNLKQKTILLSGLNQSIKACNYQQTLERGFAVIKTSNHKVVGGINELKNYQNFVIKMQDGEIFIESKNLNKNISETQPNLFDLMK
jgi:exodeoxyribonuclease VII large subunit